MVDGRVLAGRAVRLAGARHLRDLVDGPARGLCWDPDTAAHALDFFPRFLRLAEGEHAGHPFRLQPWQVFIVGSLFGWLGVDGYRRFRTAYIEIGKGNGKTPMAAGIALYALTMDGEAGAEVYCAAVTRDQARIAFTDAKKMAEASGALAARLEILEHNIADHASRSFMRPVSSEGKGLDGKRVHLAITDEVHEHPDATVVDKMRAGTKGRRQALIVEITNSGYDRQTVCWAHHEYSAKLLDGVLTNDTWFAYVCQLDPCEPCRAAGHDQTQDGCEACDDWRAEATWPKVNPNLGVSVTAKYLREQVTEALGMPSKENIVRRLSMCRWTESATRWIPADAWAACGGPLDVAALKGRRCFGGLDLASTTDTAAFALLFPPDEDVPWWALLVRFFLPEANMAGRVARDRVKYDVWAREGWITLTPGNQIDDEFIRAQIRQDAETYRLVELAYDRWNASSLVTRLQEDGATVVPIGQGFQSLSGPTKAFEVLVTGRRPAAADPDGAAAAPALEPPRLRHGDNPVMAWQIANVVVRSDPAGNLKPDKERSKEKIDGPVAGIMALARAMLAATPTGPRISRL